MGLFDQSSFAKFVLKGRDAARTGDWDAAVTYYTAALQANPDNAEYKIELEREAETYCEKIMALPAMQEWAAAARNEPMIIDAYEF